MISEFLSALLLALIQGISEWIPISSSGHLVLFERIFDYSGSLMFDVALHFGTLMAVFVYFGKEITDILRDFFVGKWRSDNGRMAWFLIVASVPAVIVGFLVKDIFDSVLSDFRVVALGFGVTGLLLLVASIDRGRRKREGKISYGKAFLIGIAQALAIFPGISRSGSTISSGLLLGLDERKAMKFAFLMSIPVVFGANILIIGNNTLPPELLWATLVSFFVGLTSIHVLFKYILVSRKNLRWFGIYCLLLAFVLLMKTFLIFN